MRAILMVTAAALACGRVGFDRTDAAGDGAISLGQPCELASECGADAPMCQCGTCQNRERTCCTSDFQCSQSCGAGACDPLKGEACDSDFDCARGCGKGQCDPGPGDPCDSDFDCARGCGAGFCDPGPGDPCDSLFDCASRLCTAGRCE